VRWLKQLLALQLKKHILRKHLHMENAFHVNFDANDGIKASTSWIGLGRLEQERVNVRVLRMSGPVALKYLTSKMGMTLFNWNGR